MQVGAVSQFSEYAGSVIADCTIAIKALAAVAAAALRLESIYSTAAHRTAHCTVLQL
jgi:hypothetical protein